MKKETLYLWIIAMLVFINALQIGTFFFKKKPPRLPRHHHHHQDFRERAVEILKLTKEQKKLFFTLAEKHSNEIHELNNKEKSLTYTYFNNPTTEGLEAVLSLQSKKIKITENHFNEIEAMLTKQQLLNYQEFKNKAIQVIHR